MLNRKNLLMAYASGGGASGVAASLSYAALIDVGFTPKTTLYLMLIVPLAELVSFLFINETNALASNSSSTTSLIEDGSGDTIAAEAPSMTLSEKWQYLPKLIKYFNPLLINYICEFVINQMVNWIEFINMNLYQNLL